MAKRQKKIFFDFTCGGVLERGFYINGVEKPLHIHCDFRSSEEISGKETYCENRNEIVILTDTIKRFTNKVTDIHLIRAYDEGSAEYAVSPKRNPHYFAVKGNHFCPNRKFCPLCAKDAA